MSSPDRFDVFLSYHWRDHVQVEAIARALRAKDLKVFLDRWYLVPGQPWPDTLERILGNCSAVAVCIGREMGPWQQREKVFALDRQCREPDFPVIPVLLPGADPVLGFLGQNTWVDFRTGLDQPTTMTILAAAVRREYLEEGLRAHVENTLATICPYKGLAFFREEDAAFFFGRDRAICTLSTALAHRNFVAVVGASGSGKSSVVRAGLVPKLRGDKQTPWEVVSLVPGDRPLYNLAAGLMPLLEPEKSENDRLMEIGKQAQAFREGTVRVRDVVERILQKQAGTKRFLLIVDQWEELYTLASRADSRLFIDGLLEATDARALSVVLTLRGDFMGQAIGYRPLADWLQDAQVNLGPMNSAELHQAITEPANKVNTTFETGLAERILNDVGDEPGHLPLLEFVLQQLWIDPERNGHPIRHAAYDALGGVDEALARHADAVLAQLAHERDQLQRVFVQLVRPGEGTADTRQVATRTQVGEANWPLVSRLADARLVVTGRKEVSGEETIEIVHEALIEHWKPLQKWLEHDRDFRRWQNRLRQSIQEWEEQHHDDGALLRGARLAEAEEQLAKRMEEVGPKERSFIQASVALRDSEIEARQRRVRITVTGLLSGLMIALGLAWWANSERRHAEAATERERTALHLAQSRQLAVQADLALNRPPTDIVLGTLLTSEALQREHTLEAYRVWSQAMTLLPRDVHRFSLLEAQRVEAFDFSPDSKRVAAIVQEGWKEAEVRTRIWDSVMMKSVAEVAHAGQVAAVAFSPDGASLATASWDHTVAVSDVATGTERHRFTQDAPVFALAFSPDGQRLAEGGRDGKINVYALHGGALVQSLQHKGEVTRVAFGPNGHQLISSGPQEATAWDGSAGQQVRAFGQEKGTESLDFSTDGRFVATVREGEASVSLWSVDGGGRSFQLKHGVEVTSVAFGGASGRLATVGADNAVRVWDAATGKELARFQHTADIRAVWPSSDGRHFVTQPNLGPLDDSGWGRLNRLLLWSVDTPSAPVRELENPERVDVVAVGPEGHSMATDGADRRVLLWDLDSGRQRGELPAQDGVRQLVFSPDGRRLAVVSHPSGYGEGYTWGEARVWEADSGREMLRFGGAPRLLHGIAYSPDDSQIATAGNDGVVTVWDAHSGAERQRLPHSGKVLTVDFTPDSQRLLTRTEEGMGSRAYQWDVATGRQLAAMTLGDPGGVTGLQFNRDHSLVATAGVDDTVRIWETRTGREVRRFEVPKDPDAREIRFRFAAEGKRLAWKEPDGRSLQVRDVATGKLVSRLEHDAPIGIWWDLSADGKRALAEIRKTRTVWIWEVDSGRVLSRLGPPERAVYGPIQLNPDGSTVATITFPPKGRAALWDAATGRLVSELRHETEHPSSVMLQDFTPDGRHVVTSSQLGLHVWDAHSGEHVRVLPSGSLSPDGTYVVHADQEMKTIELSDVGSGRRIARFANPVENHIHGFDLSPDGTRFAIGTMEPKVFIIDTESGQLLGRLKLDGDLWTLGFLPDNRTILTFDRAAVVKAWYVDSGHARYRIAHASKIDRAVMDAASGRVATANGTLAQIWDVASGRQLARLSHREQVKKLAISAGGRRVATLDSDWRNEARNGRDRGIIWDVDTAKEIGWLAHDDSIKALAFSSDGSRLVTASDDHTVRLWDGANDRELSRLNHDYPVQGLAASRDDQLIAAYAPAPHATEKAVQVWHLPTRRRLARLPHYGEDVERLGFSPDGRWLATAGRAPLRLWDPQSAHPERFSISFSDGPATFAVSPDGQRLYALEDGEGKAPDRIRVLDSSTGRTLFDIVQDSIYRFVLSPDGQRLASWGAEPAVRIWNAHDGQQLARLDRAPGGNNTMAFSSDGRKLATVDGATLKFWDLDTLTVREFAHEVYANEIAFGPGDGLLVTAEGTMDLGDFDPVEGSPKHVLLGLQVARVWAVTSGREVLRLSHQNPVHQARFSPDGRFLVTYDYLGTRVWEVANGTHVADLKGSGQELQLGGFNAKGDYFAASSDAETVIWEVPTWREAVRLPHAGYRGSLVFSPDGKYLAEEHGDEVSVWDWAQQRELARVAAPICTGIAFTPGGGLVTANWGEDALRVWSWQAQDLVADACSRIERNLTQAEWRLYVGNEPYRPTCLALPVPDE